MDVKNLTCPKKMMTDKSFEVSVKTCLTQHLFLFVFSMQQIWTKNISRPRVFEEKECSPTDLIFKIHTMVMTDTKKKTTRYKDSRHITQHKDYYVTRIITFFLFSRAF